MPKPVLEKIKPKSEVPEVNQVAIDWIHEVMASAKQYPQSRRLEYISSRLSELKVTGSS